MLYDRGDGVGAMPAAQMAELAGHRSVAVLLGGLAAWSGPVESGQVELQPVKTTFEPRFDAVPTRDELAERLGDPALMLLDVRTDDEFRGKQRLSVRPAPGPHSRRAPPAGRRALRRSRASRFRATRSARASAMPDEVVAYCHSGSRSALATLALRAAGYRARNYAGSWHEWSRHDELPMERG